MIAPATFTVRPPSLLSYVELTSDVTKIGSSTTVLLYAPGFQFSPSSPRRVRVTATVSVDATVASRIAFQAVLTNGSTVIRRGFCVRGTGSNSQQSGAVSFVVPALSGTGWYAQLLWSTSAGMVSCRPVSQFPYEHATLIVQEENL